MYSTLPPVIGELVANAWDANATTVEIDIPETALDERKSVITISDNGIGMSDDDIRRKFVIVGRDRRTTDGSDITPSPLRRRVMGRKGIGKFSAFGIAKEIEIETVRGGQNSRWVMNYDDMLACGDDRRVRFPILPPSGNVMHGTVITLKKIARYRTRRIPLPALRRGLARRFAVIGAQSKFEVVVNGDPITVHERDLKRLLARDAAGKPYLWSFDNEEVAPGTGWTVSGWIGALDRTMPKTAGVDDGGVSIMARGKLVQEPFLFRTTVGQQYALSYIVGELHAEFVDEVEDTVGTNRNALVWDVEANAKLMEWGSEQLQRIAREWAKKRGEDNRRRIEGNELYAEFRRKAQSSGQGRAMELADKLVRQAIERNPTAEEADILPIIQTSLDFLEFDAFWAIAKALSDADVSDMTTLLQLFREWEVVEAGEMARVTRGRIETIKKLEHLIDTDAKEVPTIHQFLKEFPWVIDPRWMLIDDEVRYSKMLREEFPESDIPEQDRRIDFLCVREGGNLVVVEIKRPSTRASKHELDQIEDYVNFTRDYVGKATDKEFSFRNVVGYLLCGNVVDSYQVRQKIQNLEKAQIFVRKYVDLLRMVEKMHKEFIDRYDALRMDLRND